jgi:DNA-binding LytR/AlgR family response regulator
MNYPYIIIDDDQESVLKTKATADGFSELVFLASANNYTDGLNLILEHAPKIIFLEIDPADKSSNLSLSLINELYRYLKIIPKIIITTSKKELAFDAIQFDVVDYMIKPIQRVDLIKTFLRLKKLNVEDDVYIVQKQSLTNDQKRFIEPKSVSFDTQQLKQKHQEEFNNEIVLDGDQEESYEDIQDENQGENQGEFQQGHKKQISNSEQPLIICIKSYGDYRYIDAKDICYFQADNNSTDIYLSNGEMVTAFKTLKHFEGILSFPFIRIHNSYILNRNYISRIHTGNADFYIKNTTTKLPFSKSYKANVDQIIAEFSNGNYLEI